MVLSNRNIDAVILSGNKWAIDANFAIAELNRYLSQLDAKEAGVQFSDLGIQQRKRAMLPNIATIEGKLFKEHKANTDTFDAISSSDIPKNSFAVLHLYGAMRTEGDWCSYGMRDFADWIAMANDNKNISGILIKANTGGGEVLAGQILRNAIAESWKPVVVHADTLASAGVDGTFPATEIIASGAGSQIGSIGVLCSFNKKMVKWYRKNIEEMYSSKSPKKNQALRAYLKGDPSLIVKEVDEAADIFHKHLKQYRPQAYKVQDVLDGDIFYAEKAREYGLVDGIGTLSYALRRLYWHTQQY